MIDKLELARARAQELRESGDDIVGAIVAGSVARGEDNETSDVDLVMFTNKKLDAGQKDRSTSIWRDGVFIDTGLLPLDTYSNLEQAMSGFSTATQVRDAIILFDPTRVLTEMQSRISSSPRDSLPPKLKIRITFSFLNQITSHKAHSSSFFILFYLYRSKLSKKLLIW